MFLTDTTGGALSSRDHNFPTADLILLKFGKVSESLVGEEQKDWYGCSNHLDLIMDLSSPS